MPVRIADQTVSDIALAAGTPVVTTLSVALASRWTLHVTNTGSANAITALRYRRRLRAGASVHPSLVFGPTGPARDLSSPRSPSPSVYGT